MLRNAQKRIKLQSVIRVILMVSAAVVILGVIVSLSVDNVQWRRIDKARDSASDYLRDIVNKMEFNGLSDEVVSMMEEYSSLYTGYSNFIVVDGNHRVLYALNRGHLDDSNMFYASPLYLNGALQNNLLYVMDEQGNLMSSHAFTSNNNAALVNLSKPLVEMLNIALESIEYSSGVVTGMESAVRMEIQSFNGTFTYVDVPSSADSDHVAEYYGFPSKDMHLFLLHDNMNPQYIHEMDSMASARDAVGILIMLAVLAGIAYWLLMATWVFLDASRRDNHPALWSVLALFTNAVGLIIYLAVRPELQQCKVCKEPVGTDYIVCPVCGARNRETCGVCGRIVDENWNICPYCAKAIERGAEEEQAEITEGQA